MQSSESVTGWINHLQQGDKDAAAHLWSRYFSRMVQAARARLQGKSSAVRDAEDIALSAFDTFCRGTAKGDFPGLDSRRELWMLLLTITSQKTIDSIRWHRRLCRGGGRVLRDADLDGRFGVGGIQEAVSREPTPELLALMNEQCEQLLAQLRDDTLRAIARWKLEGHNNAQIADFLGISIHTVGRKLRLIRLTWSRHLTNTNQDTLVD